MKNFVIKTVCKLLGKSLVYLKANDMVFYGEFKTLPKNLTVSLSVMNDGTYLNLVKNGDELCVEKRLATASDLEIVFKNCKSAKRPLLGAIGVRESFSRHDILLKGNINTAVILVRLIERAEGYLFPRFITKKYLPKINKNVSGIKVLWFCLFGNCGRISNKIPTNYSKNANMVRKNVVNRSNVVINSQNDIDNNEIVDKNCKNSDIQSQKDDNNAECVDGLDMSPQSNGNKGENNE